MNNKADRTKQRIKDTVVKLMHKKLIEEITVKETMEILKLNRSTFYLHYNDLYQVIEEIEIDVLQNVDKIIKEYSNDFNAMLKKVISYIKENKDIFNVLLNKFNYHFQDKLFVMLQKKFIMHYPNAANDAQAVKYNSYFCIQGSIGVISAWLTDNCSYPQDDLFKCILSYIIKD